LVIAIDTTILAYAVNRFAPEHPRAVQVVEELVNGEIPWALPWSVVHEFLHLVTHPHAVARPLKPSDAWGFVGQIAASPTVRMLGPTARHGQALVEVMASVPSGSGMVPGLETATLLREHGIRELLSADRAMRRFPFLSVRDPLHEQWSTATRPQKRYRVLKPRPA
jgi:predicted nucleic acid-binding protein